MKQTRIFSMAALALAATLSLLPQRAAAQTLRGDFDMDGCVSISDVTSLINCLLTDSPGEPKPSDYDTITVNGVPFVMVRVEGGVARRFMGDSPLTVETFSIGQTEVTQELWKAVMGEQDDPPYNETGDLTLPVDCASRNDCMAFIARLNELTGLSFRLPTWDEWLYAATGGKFTRFYQYAGSDDIDEVAWYRGSLPGPGIPWNISPVAKKAPNELYLYDMTGNVAEWAHEWSSAGDFGDFGAVYGGRITNVANDCIVDIAKVTALKVNVRYDFGGLRLVL
ncbi:MAG: formylglycine-generating enzyme family protein [Muribaculaceae bacterium]|nr:formylglycine-generating enzyme family protein [Muribaculaceae bacterium]